MLGKTIIVGASLLALSAVPIILGDNNIENSKSFLLFGDSLSVDGNDLEVFGEKIYWEGRFSNGPLWDEYTSYLLNMTLVNYAFGGATSSNTGAINGTIGTQLIPSFIDQIDAFLKNNTKIAKPEDDIVAVDIGSNNFLDLISDPLVLVNNRTGFIDQITSDTVKGLQTMADAGYRRFFVWNIPNLWLHPNL